MGLTCRSTPSTTLASISSMSNQDLEPFATCIPAGVHDAVERPRMLAGMAEAEAVVTRIAFHGRSKVPL